MRAYAKWRKHCDCRPTGDGKITTWKSCEDGWAKSIECEYGIKKTGKWEQCKTEEDERSEKEAITCKAGWWNFGCRSRCPERPAKCSAYNEALKQHETEEEYRERYDDWEE